MRRTLLPLTLLMALVLGACAPQGQQGTSSPPGPAFPITLTDDEGVSATVDAVPKRIVTWAPSLTEDLFAMGVGKQVVGVSGDFDNYPADAKSIEHVGGSGVEPNVEKVVSLQPDLVLDGFGGGADWKQRLRDQSIPVFTVVARNFGDLLHDLVTIGRLVGADAKAAQLIGDLQAQATKVQVPENERVTCFFEVGFEGGFFTVGPGSFIYDLLDKAGCDPVTSGAKDSFPQWSVEQLVAEDPDVYLVSSESGGTVAAVGKRPGFGDLRAVKQGKVVLIDSDLVSRPGPRVVQGLQALADALHGTAA